MNIIKKLLSLTITILLILSIAGCNKGTKVLYQSDSIKITRNDAKTTVYDLLQDKEYNYITLRIKRSEKVYNNKTSVDAPTLKIEIISNGLKIYDKTEKKIFILTHKGKILHLKG